MQLPCPGTGGNQVVGPNRESLPQGQAPPEQTQWREKLDWGAENQSFLVKSVTGTKTLRAIAAGPGNPLQTCRISAELFGFGEIEREGKRWEVKNGQAYAILRCTC
jgi:hypothetical protein